MKVLHVIPSLSPVRGGPSTALALMARGLGEAGITVEVVTTDDNGPDRSNVPLGVPLEANSFVTRYFPRQTRFYTFSWPLTRWLAGHIRKYDLVHVHALFSYPSLAAGLLARRYHVPYIVRPLGTLNRWGFEHRRPLLKQLSFQLAESRVLAGAAAVHLTSGEELAEVRSLGIPFHPAVIPLGIDLAPFAAIPPADAFLARYPEVAGRSIVLFLSRLDPKKGLDLLLPAFTAVRRAHPDTVLVVAGNGDPSFVANLRSASRELGIEGGVLWTGFLEGSLKLSALAAAALFVLPSYSENFGVAPVEAMAAGLPVVVSDRVAVASDIAAHRAGLVVPTAVEDLSSAISTLLTDRALRLEMGSNGRQLARDRFSVEAMTRDLIALYCEIGEGNSVHV